MNNLVAVSLEPANGRVMETDFHRANHWHTGKGGHIIIERDGETVATYRSDAVRSIRFSRRDVRPGVTFVRTFKEFGG